MSSDQAHPSAVWYLRAPQGEESGPLTPGELRQRIRQGILGPGTLIRHRTWEHWHPLEELYPEAASAWAAQGASASVPTAASPLLDSTPLPPTVLAREAVHRLAQTIRLLQVVFALFGAWTLISGLVRVVLVREPLAVLWLLQGLVVPGLCFLVVWLWSGYRHSWLEFSQGWSALSLLTLVQRHSTVLIWSAAVLVALLVLDFAYQGMLLWAFRLMG